VWRSGADRLRPLGQVEVRRRVERLRDRSSRQELLTHLVEGPPAPIIIERGGGCAAGLIQVERPRCVLQSSDLGGRDHSVHGELVWRAGFAWASRARAIAAV
jgi:hypothetical protein